MLDTSACIEHLRGRSPSVTGRLAAEAARVALCSVVVTELLYGVYRSEDAAEELVKVSRFITGFPSLPFDDVAADEAAKIRSSLAAIGTPIGPYDLLIASISVANGLTLVTSNSAEFSRVPNLAVEDWRGN